MKRCVFLILLLLFSLKIFAEPLLESPFDFTWDPEEISTEPGGEFKITIYVSVPSEHFIYKDKTKVELISSDQVKIKAVSLPEPADRFDPYLGKTTKIYASEFPIEVLLTVDKGLVGEILRPELILKFQGCSEKLCFRPERHTIELTVNLASQATLAATSEEMASAGIGAGFGGLLKGSNFQAVLDKGAFFTIVLVFLAGVLVSLTPCVWPVIPVVLLIIGIKAREKWWKNLPLSISLVLGILLVNSVMGIGAAFLGKNLGFLFQNKFFVIFLIAFFIAMSLSMFGLFNFALFGRFRGFLEKFGGKGFGGAFLAGAGVGFISSPCASPVLAGLLSYVALQQSYFMGLGLMMVFGLGMGLLFIIMGTFFGIMSGRLKGGKWMQRVKQILGVLLLLPAIFYLKSLVAWDKIITPGNIEKPRVEWISSVDVGLSFAKDSARPVIMDFYADWCPPCHELENVFFSREKIVKLTYQMVPIRVNGTWESDELERLVERYGVVGWPTILFLSPGGKVYSDLTVVSYDPETIEKNMLTAIERAKKEGK